MFELFSFIGDESLMVQKWINNIFRHKIDFKLNQIQIQIDRKNGI